MKSRQNFMHIGRLFERPEHRPAIDHTDRVQLKQERRNDAKVAATTAYCPEQIGMLLGTGCDKAAIGKHHFNAEQVVDRQAQCSVRGSQCLHPTSVHQRQWSK